MNEKELELEGQDVTDITLEDILAEFDMDEVEEATEVAQFIPAPMERPVEEINVEVNVETQEVTVKGTTGNQNVKVTVTGEIKPDTIVKWRTKTKKEVINTGYPRLKNISKVTEEPTSPNYGYE